MPARKLSDAMLDAALVRRARGETLVSIATSMDVTNSALSQALSTRRNVPRRGRLPSNWREAHVHSVYITDDQMHALKAHAARENRSVASLIHHAIAVYLDLSKGGHHDARPD